MATAPEERIVGGSGGQGAKEGKCNRLLSPLPVFSHLTPTAAQCGSYLPVTAEETDAQSG